MHQTRKVCALRVVADGAAYRRSYASEKMTKMRHALTGAEYEAESPNSVRVTDGERWGRFDRYGGWLEGEIIQCDAQLCLWLTGRLTVQARADATSKSKAGET